MEVDKDRGLWVDPRDAQMPLSEWAGTFLSRCQRLSPNTQETYRRDIERYILPRLGPRRMGRLSAEEIENWLNEEIDAGWHLPPCTATTERSGECCGSPSSCRSRNAR